MVRRTPKRKKAKQSAPIAGSWAERGNPKRQRRAMARKARQNKMNVKKLREDAITK